MTEPVRGENFELYSIVRNTGSENLKDVNLKLYIYDLGEMWVSQGYTIQDNDHDVLFMEWDVPKNIKQGTYLARLSAGNDHERDRKHIFVKIQ